MSSIRPCPLNPNANPRTDLAYLKVLRSADVTSSIVPPTWRPQLHTISMLPPSPLDNGIHPLFMRSKWRGLRPQYYGLLAPALRIATKFLTEPLLLRWWKHTLFGRVALDMYGRRHLVCTPFEATDHATKQLHMILEKILPAVLEVRFHNLDKKGLRIDGCAFGSKASYLEFCRDDGHNPLMPWDPIFDMPRIVLHSQFLFSLKYLLRYGSAGEIDNLNLRMAITLCHELAHVVWKYRVSKQVSPWAPDVEYMEPLHQADENLAELGHSWELYVFGGSIWTMDRPGWFATFYRPRTCEINLSGMQSCVVVPQWWISMWSRAHTWSNFLMLYHLGQLRLPSEQESGYALCESRAGHEDRWTLYMRGQPVLFHCLTPKASVFYLWHEVRPLFQRILAQEEALVDLTGEEQWEMLCDLHREFGWLLMSSDFVDETSPKIFRRPEL